MLLNGSPQVSVLQMFCVGLPANRKFPFESNLESAATIRIRIESGGSRLHVQCRLSCGSYVFNDV